MQVHNEIVRNIARHCEAFGVKEADIYRVAGINETSIAVSDGMQDWKVSIKVWESAIQLTNYRLISLSFGKIITFSVLGWISPLTSSSPNLKLAWKSFTQFFPLMGDVFRYELVELADGSIKIRYYPSQVWVDASPLTAALATEHAMSLTLSLSGYLSGKIIKPQKTTFCHEIENKYLAPFKDFFGNVLFGQKENALVFDATTANLPSISGNQLMYENMLTLCSEKMGQLQGNSSYSNKVLQILNSKQAYFNPKLEEVAAKLNMSARTLQRKLKEEQQTYQQLLEEYQVETATHLLARPNTQVQEVAFMLGFTSLQSFSRAFKRKTGISPTQAKVKFYPDTTTGI